jgi:hypothetical protein
MADHADFKPAVPYPVSMEIECPHCEETYGFNVHDRDNGAWYADDPEGFGGGEWHKCLHCDGLIEIRPVFIQEILTP